jgi:hypothetical protein
MPRASLSGADCGRCTNVGNTASQAITIDTTPRGTGTPDLAAASDSGTSNTDNNTNDNTPTFTGTGVNGTTVIILDGVTAVGSAVVSGGTYTITTSALADGVHKHHRNDFGYGGQRRHIAALSVQSTRLHLRHTGTPDLVAASDSGTSSTDNITNDTTPTFHRLGVNGTTVTILDGVTAVGSAGGQWRHLHHHDVGLVERGPQHSRRRQSDTAGNVGTSAALSVTIDTVGPTVSVTSNPTSVSNGSSSTITYQFSEAVTGFDATDTTATRGTLSSFAQWMRTLTPQLTLGRAAQVALTSMSPTIVSPISPATLGPAVAPLICPPACRFTRSISA